MSDFPKTTEHTATTKLACNIAMTNPDRLNEAIRVGYYPCAPATRQGKARSFDVNDIIALRLYQRFLDRGTPPAGAGDLACEVRTFLHQHPDADQAYIVTPSIGSQYVLPDLDVKDQHMPAAIDGDTRRDVLAVEVWNFHYLRGRIVHEINEAAFNVGEAD